MAKRCPPGVICFENMSIVVIILAMAIIVMFFYFNNIFKSNTGNNINSQERIIIKDNSTNNSCGLFSTPGNSYSNLSNDVLMNPYEAPLRDNNYHPKDSSDVRGIPAIPINVPTQSVEASYRQIGILTRANGQEMILPLMGKPLMTNRDKWNFYTMSDKNNMIKLPVIVNGKSGTHEYGVDNLYNGDSVYVEGYNDAFKVTVYENNAPRYIPIL